MDRDTARGWIERWDRQQEESLPDREDRFTALIDAVEEGTGRADPVVLGGDLYDRLGVCTAPRCDRVYVDTSRNGTRRYCSTSCQNRVKTAAFRARLA